MTVWQAVLLGLLQGATEFLPISSSAHLVLVPWLLGWPEPGVFFDAMLHLGTLLAVVAYFWRALWFLLLALMRTLRVRRIETAYERLAWLLIVATVPGALAGVFLEDWFAAIFGKPTWVAALLLATGVLLFAAERLAHARKPAEQASIGDALIVGLAQAVAILPGISRSGATISAGMSRGISRAEAARFSFLLAVPITAAAGLLSLAKSALAGDASGLAMALLGAAAAAIAGFLAIRSLLRYLRSRSLTVFAYYCWLFGALCLLLALLRA
ncbi:MAG: undecaprenyl-diphosphate phosphatase [Anaerolineae bacterium]